MSGGSTSTATQRRVSTVSTMLCTRSPAIRPQLEARGDKEEEGSLNLQQQQGGAEDSPDPQHQTVGRLGEAEPGHPRPQ